MRGSPLWLPIFFGLGGCLVGLIELAALGSASLSLVWVTLSLLTVLGLFVGLVACVVEQAVAHFRVRGTVAALLRALPVVPVLAWVCAHLFDGAQARTLPGASWAHVWGPALGVLGLAFVFWLVGYAVRSRVGRGAVFLALCLTLMVVEYTNRTFLVREYLDVHAFLTLVSVACAGGLVWLPTTVLPQRAWDRVALARIPVLIAASAACAIVLIDIGLVLHAGLDARADRWLVATRGMHTRQVARVVRRAMDLDGDGYAAALGGGDCDEGDAEVNPGAEDIPQDGLDQDCDGLDAAPAAAPEPVPEDEERATATWVASQELRDLTERARSYHVVLVVVDALRADAFEAALDPTQDQAPRYPALHALARDARYFSRAFASASGTDYSLAGLLTSRADPFVPVPQTLLEALATMGFTTHAVLPREVLRWACQPLITRGLASHDTVITDKGKRDVGDHSTSAETTDLGLAFLDAHLAARPDAPVFLWLHYFDVHEHHQMAASDARLQAVMGPDGSLDGPARYRALTHIVDQEIGRLRNELEARGVWRDTVFILLSDHGEGLGEDERLPDTHGRYVYNALVHVPLLVRVPDIEPAVIDRPVSLLDVAPTLLALMGRDPLPGSDGISLLPWLVDSAPASARARMTPIALNESDQYGVIDWPYKLMLRPADNLLELYDLASDFAEEHDLSPTRPEEVQRLRAVLRGLPRVHVDRTLEARKRRDRIARPGTHDP